MAATRSSTDNADIAARYQCAAEHISTSRAATQRFVKITICVVALFATCMILYGSSSPIFGRINRLSKAALVVVVWVVAGIALWNISKARLESSTQNGSKRVDERLIGSYSPQTLFEHFETADLLVIPPGRQFLLGPLDAQFVGQFARVIENGGEDTGKKSLQIMGNQLSHILLPLGNKMEKISSSGSLDLAFDPTSRAIQLTSNSQISFECSRGDLVTSMRDLHERMIATGRSELILDVGQNITFTGFSKLEIEQMNSIEVILRFVKRGFPSSHDISFTTEGRLGVGRMQLLNSFGVSFCGNNQPLMIKLETVS